MKGNRFLLSNFDGSPTCVAGAWVKKLEAFFLLHPVVDRKVVEIVALHLEGEANTWWFSHWSHARVSTLAEFSQKMIRIFCQRREEPSPLVEEAYTSTVTVMEEQPSCSAREEGKIVEEGDLAYTSHQGMLEFPSLVISVNPMKGCKSFMLLI